MKNTSKTQLLFMSFCSIVTCSLTMKYYVEENVSQRSCTTIRHVVKMLGSISETLIFFFLGVVTITTEHEWNWGYILFTLLFAFVWRGLGKEGRGLCFVCLSLCPCPVEVSTGAMKHRARLVCVMGTQIDGSNVPTKARKTRLLTRFLYFRKICLCKCLAEKSIELLSQNFSTLNAFW